MFIDSHSHIYSTAFTEAEKTAVMERAMAAQVSRVLMPAIDSSTHPLMLALENQFPGACYSMMGLHPGSVNENYKKELDIVAAYLTERRFIAIGETGLDFYWDLRFKNEQIESFEQQIEWALEYGLPVVIHSRAATDACIDIIKKHTPRGLRGVFHCFSGTAAQAGAIVDEGFYLGIGGVLTYKKSTLAEDLQHIPLEHLLLETDAPYLAPVPFRGKRNEPSYMVHTAAQLAAVKGLPVEEIARQTTLNAQKLFAL